MKIRDLFDKPTDVVSIQQIISNSRLSYPNTKDDLTALCFSVSTLEKNIKERTFERDRYHAQLIEAHRKIKLLEKEIHAYRA